MTSTAVMLSSTLVPNAVFDNFHHRCAKVTFSEIGVERFQKSLRMAGSSKGAFGELFDEMLQVISTTPSFRIVFLLGMKIVMMKKKLLGE